MGEGVLSLCNVGTFVGFRDEGGVIDKKLFYIIICVWSACIILIIAFQYNPMARSGADCTGKVGAVLV